MSGARPYGRKERCAAKTSEPSCIHSVVTPWTCITASRVFEKALHLPTSRLLELRTTGQRRTTNHSPSFRSCGLTPRRTSLPRRRSHRHGCSHSSRVGRWVVRRSESPARLVWPHARLTAERKRSRHATEVDGEWLAIGEPSRTVCLASPSRWHFIREIPGELCWKDERSRVHGGSNRPFRCWTLS